MTTDHLGSLRITTDQFGQIASRRDFMPFGEELGVDIPLSAGTNGQPVRTTQHGCNADTIRQKFTGYQKDNETGLDFAEARMYENRHARFTAVDPLLASGKSADPQTFNRYVYVMNNPLAYTDPTGLQAATSPYWTYRDDKAEDGTIVRTFRRYTSEEQQKLHETARGGESFQRWTGQDFYVWDDGRGIYFGEGGSGAGLLFSTAAFSQETLSGLFATQNAGENFNPDQIGGLKTAAVEALNQLPEIQLAKATSAIGGGLLAGGTTAGTNYFLRNVAFGTERGGAVFFSGQNTFTPATEFATNFGRQTIEMTAGGRALNFTTNLNFGGYSVRNNLPHVNNRLWGWGSQHFARGTSGEATVFLGTPLRPNNIWSTIERPILERNPNVILNFRRVPSTTTP